MKIFLLFLFLFLVTKKVFGQFSTKTEIIYSRYVRDSFQIYISTPLPLDSNLSYNIVYYCDANLRSGAHLRNLINNNSPNKNLVHTIFIGIGHIGNYHALRRRDFTLPAINGKDTVARDKDQGQIEKFYSFVKCELVTSINQRFKTNHDSTSVIGHSLGGLFVFFCLFKADNLFAKYFALSPALWVDNYSIYKFNKIKEGFTEKKYLFFCSGSKETFNRILHGTNRANQFFDEKKYKNLTYEYKIFRDQNHFSEVPISLAEIITTKL